MKRVLLFSASRRASVVFPVPGGPHKINDGIAVPPSIKRRNTRPSPTSCSWPTNSFSVRGRMRSASGAAVAERALELCGSLISGNKLDGLLSGILAKTSVSQMFFKDDPTTEGTEKNQERENNSAWFCISLCPLW